jgi:beta-glucosidase-like glycosyl hydrolase
MLSLIKEKPALRDNRFITSARHALLTVLIFLLSVSAFAQDAEFWYEHRLKQMSLDQKIGQLFMVAAYTNKESRHTEEIENLIQNYHIGGLIFFQNDPVKQAWLTNYYQSLASTPLMIGIDGEWGLAMRLQNTQRFPYAITMGAIKNDSLVYEAGAAIGKQCKRLGIHINFAPDVDINVNMDNPIIGFRAFGDNKYNVARKGIAYSNGLLSQNVLSCAKHFPGHGDVNTDSHIGLPIVDKSVAELDSLELYPFKQLIQSGVPSIMVAHIHFPKLDSRSNRSASLSYTIIDTLLRQHLQFEGLVFTDAMNMKGVASYYQPGYADLEAIKAGNDVLLFSENVAVAFDLIKASVLNGTLSEADIDKRVLKILKWKQFAGLDHYEPIITQNLLEDLEGRENFTLLQTMANNAVSIVKNSQQSLPLKHKDKVLYLALGDLDHSEWKRLCALQHGAAYRQVAKNPDNTKITSLQNLAKGYDKVVISFHQPKV